MPAEAYEAYRAVAALERYPRYLGALIFGSMARGDSTALSDFDVKVVVDEDNACRQINHPVIDGIKLDISFLSMAQLRQATEDEIAKRERVPIVAESLIVFDHTGELTRLQQSAVHVRPKPFTAAEHQYVQFMLYHANSKVERHLQSDPAAALVVMHISLTDVLRLHYQIREHWWVSDKRLLRDLRSWDPALAELVEGCVMSADVATKYGYWSAIMDHVVAPLGGRQPISENNCDCAVCRADLVALVAEVG